MIQRFKSRALSAANIKIIAAAAMLLDHISKVFTPFNRIVPFGYDFNLALEAIGRLAFPIFAYFIAVGCVKTHNMKKYLLRLLLVCIISEPCYDFAFSLINSMRYKAEGDALEFASHGICFWEGGIQNVCFSLFLAALAVYCLQRYLNRASGGTRQKVLWAFVLAAEWCLVYFLAAFGNCDYWSTAIPLVLALYLARRRGLQAGILVIWSIAEYLFIPQYGSIPIINTPFDSILCALFASASAVILLLYHGEKGEKRLPKYFFYWFYPLHLCALGVIREILILL